MKPNLMHWIWALTGLACLAITLVVMHSLTVRSYSSPGLLGLASGFSIIAAVRLFFSLIPRKHSKVTSH